MKSRKSKVEERAGDVVDMEEAIALLKTTRQTFYRWLRSGKLKGMKVGRQWRFYKEDVERFLKGEGPRVELPGSLKPFISMLEKRLAGMGKTLKTPLTGSEDLQAVLLMILAGYYLKASDMHLEPQAKAGGETKVMLRYRIDGVLSTFGELDLPLLKPIIERWKIMGNANIHETTKPQDCRIQLNIEGAVFDMRVCFVPACLGESLTCRFLDPKGVRLSLDNIPYSPRDRDAINRFLASPWGLMFVTGPQGSGKTTVLYSCLQQCAGPERKVMSVEDPVEYLIPWVTQMQIRPAEGLTYAACMRSIMRSDPDVVMVGEIRDVESMHVAQQMALTGHLVMSTLHTQSAVAALIRLCEMGADPFLVADSTRLILAQRLVRKVCPECAQKVSPDKEDMVKAMEMAKAGGLDVEALPKGWRRRAEGCAHCRMTGYRGRTVIAEALVVTREIGTALRQRATPAQLQALAVSQGMTTMAADGVRRAATGETTLEEVFRMLPPAG